MANNENLIPIPGRLHSVATEGHVSGADEIYDDTQQKDQATINSELISAVGTGGSVDSKIAASKAEIIGDAATDYNTLGKLEDKIQAEASRAEAAEEALDGRVDTLEDAVGTGGSVDSRISAAVATETTRAQAAEADRYTKSETYSKTELNNLITTPNQEYVSVTTTAQTTAVTDVLPATGAADTTYRVGNWDGTQYNDSVFSEYAWNGSAYIKLSTKSQVGEVYDISVNHADTKYADLAAALGTNGANIPQSLRKGGMSVKFVQSSDNKYVQYRLMLSTFTTHQFVDAANWQGEDVSPTLGSKNLVESGGVANVTELAKSAFDYTQIDLSQFTPVNGHISNGNWTDVDSALRKHITVPLNGAKCVSIQSNEGEDTILYFLSSYDSSSIEEGASANTVDIRKVISANNIKTYNVPDGANFVYFQYNSGDKSYLPSALYFDILTWVNRKILEKKVNDKLITATSLLQLSQVSSTRAYKSGQTGARIYFEFIYLVISSRLSLVMNSGYQATITLYQQDGTAVYTSSWSSKISSDTFGQYYDFAYAGITFKKSDNSATTIEDVVTNGASNIYIETLSQEREDTLDITLLNRISNDILNLNKDVHALEDTNFGIFLDLSQYTPANGYINNNEWTGTTSNTRKHIVIPTSGMNVVDITANPDYDAISYFLSDYVVVEEGAANIVSIKNTILKGTKTMLAVPDNANYLYFQVNSGAKDYTPSSVSYNSKFSELKEYVDSKMDGVGILDFNPEKEVTPKISNLKRGYHEFGYTTEDKPVFSMIHYSDIHADNDNILRVKEFGEKFSPYIDIVLNTGDFIGAQITQGLPETTDQVTDVIRVIGNHDTMYKVEDSSPRGFHWELVGQLDCYNVNLKDYIGNWGVVQPTNAATNGYCYYYKDFSAANIRLICLDGEHWRGDDNNTDDVQLAWFQSVLATAKTAGLHVIVAVHRPPFHVNTIQGNTFDSIDWPNIPDSSVTTLSGAIEAVNSFMSEENGVTGNFICWLCGHIHQDCMGLGQGIASNQLLISISCATCRESATVPYAEMVRISGTKSQDCFNIVAVDTYSKILKIQRIGAQYDRHMRKRDTFCWNYGTNQLIYCG